LEFPAHTTRTGETPTATKEHKPKRTHILAYNPETAEIPRLNEPLAGVLSFRAAKTAEIPRHLRSDAGVLPFQPMIASISHLRH
ncbi:MAG: hypothetical protein E7I49_06740, partial [Bifidobacterium longum]|nr:hypothetical protein [Bifidobacterium longum]